MSRASSAAAEIGEGAIARLIRPRTVAILGASENPVSVGGAVLANLERAGFTGDIHLVSRSRAQINGRPCVASIHDLPAGVDVVVLATPADVVADAVRACADRDVGGVVVFAAGFAEMGPEGRAHQESIASVARAAGLALAGPNCAGFISYAARAPLTFNRFEAERRQGGTGVAVIAQSGAMAANIDEGLYSRGLNVTHAISTGNEAVLGIEDFLASLIEHEQTQLAVVFAEQIRDAPRFLGLVATARRLGKPIVLMHPGRTHRARESAQSHTGAMAGDHAVMRAILRHNGVRLVDTLDEMFDVAVLLARWPQTRGSGVMVMTNSGALRSVALDLAESVGVALPPLSPKTMERLGPMFPPYASLDNPLDLLTLGLSQPDIYSRAGEVLMDDPACGGFVFASTPGPDPVQVSKASAMAPLMATSSKPVAFVMLGDEAPLANAFLIAAQEAQLPVFRSMDRALRAMAHLVSPGLAEASTRVRDGLGLSVALPAESGPLSEIEGKRILAECGVPVPAGDLASSLEAAQAVAARVGYPVALKAQARALTHKSDAGGVILGVRDAAALQLAWMRMHLDIARLSPGTVLDGVLVEAMSQRGVEMIVGARRDSAWGVVLMVGLGGVAAEVLGDFRLLPPGLSRAAIRTEIEQLKGAALLRGFRGAPPCDLDALADTLVVMGELMAGTPALTEIEINPLAVNAKGCGVCALDALVVVGAP